MKHFDRMVPSLFLAAVLAACLRSPKPGSPGAPPTATPRVFTDPAAPLSERIVYYYFVTAAENPIPPGAVSWGGILAPTYADASFTSDTAADLRTALEIVLHDGRNHWVSDQLVVAAATFGEGHADLALQGEYFGLGDGVLCAASLQILFTVFANPAVQTSTVMLNEGLIGNLCLFGPPPDHSGDYLNDAVYTRAEIEAFMQQNAYRPANTSVPPTSTRLPPNTRLSTPTPLPPTPPLVPSPAGTPIFPPIESFVGIWHGSDPESWPKIVIAGENGTLFANVRYACELPEYWTFPKDCELGLASASYSGNPVRMVIDEGSNVYTFTLTLDGDTLHVTTIANDSGHSDMAGSTIEADYFREVPSFPVSDKIIFYHFPDAAHGQLGGIRTPIFLFPGSSDQAYTTDTAADLRAALELVLQDHRNGWISRDVDITEVTFRAGHASIVLQGEVSGASNDVLTAARMQILLTLFANPTVRTAAVTLNGDTLGNLGVPNSAVAKPADYVYTRVEMETYLREHYYSLEWGGFLDRQ